MKKLCLFKLATIAMVSKFTSFQSLLLSAKEKLPSGFFWIITCSNVQRFYYLVKRHSLIVLQLLEYSNNDISYFQSSHLLNVSVCSTVHQLICSFGILERAELEWSRSRTPPWQSDISIHWRMSWLCFSREHVSLIIGDRQVFCSLNIDFMLPSAWYKVTIVHLAQEGVVWNLIDSPKLFPNSFLFLYRLVARADFRDRL